MSIKVGINGFGRIGRMVFRPIAMTFFYLVVIAATTATSSTIVLPPV